MYNPSRGGVRGGADQFTWESVKTDKHRENYLGHSLMAPVGRWQKGKDLSWYAKERKDDKTQEMIDRSEMASIKKAEEEAMLIALGHNIVKKTQTLTKEDMREALKRNTEREDHQIERIDGVGAASQRIASLSGVGKDARQNNEGVAFETVKERNIIETNDSDKGGESMPGERKKNKKKSKKHKKEKKHKKHHKESRESDASDDSSKYKTKYDKNESDDDNRKSSKIKHLKKSKHSHKDYASDSDSPDSADEKSSNLKDHKIFKPRGGAYVDSDSLDKEKRKSLKGRNHKKCKNRHKDYSSDSDSPDNADERRSSNLKDHKIFKPRGGDYVDSDSLDKEKGKSLKVRNHKKCKNRHKDYSSDSDSPASVVQHKTKHKKSKLDGDVKKSSKEKSHKKSKHKHKDYSSEISDEISHPDSQKRDNKRHKIQKEPVKRCRHDTSESD